MARKIIVQSSGPGVKVSLRGRLEHIEIESLQMEKDYVKVYQDLLNTLQGDISPLVPEVEEAQKELFTKTCLNVTYATAARDSADKSRNNIPNDDKQKKDDANNAFKEAQKALDVALQINVDAAKPILNNLSLDKIDQAALCTYYILLHGTPEKLGAFANRGNQQAAMIETLLDDSAFIREVVLADGAKGGNYGEAMQIYADIQKQSTAFDNHDILQRCALGTALEHATPMNEFDTPSIAVDPVLRYLHYEQAYLTGELDPTFCDRTVWECRMIVNCDAPNEQLGWGRSMLRNYRPDEMFTPDYIWRYCVAVRTEVGYRRPEWTSTPRTYQQLISGGGQCGPRAWFARFCCKMFGIPTWGARQPGHAMCHHWTPDGWVGVLGADWKFSNWEGRVGPDFLLETKAREKGEDVFFARVRCLQMIAAVVGEKPLDANTGLPDANSLWGSLALVAKKVLAAQEQNPPPMNRPPGKNLLVERCSMKDPVETIRICDGGRIILPATSCSKPSKSTKNIVFMPSFLGGMQLNCREGDSIEYTLSDSTAGRYQVTLRVCTVHLKQQPLLLTVEGEDSAVSVATISVPYTIGEWQYTDPVDVDLMDGVNVLCFARETPNFGLTIKEIILTPLATSR